MTDRRLREVEFLRCHGETACARERDKSAQLPAIQRLLHFPIHSFDPFNSLREWTHRIPGEASAQFLCRSIGNRSRSPSLFPRWQKDDSAFYFVQLILKRLLAPC